MIVVHKPRFCPDKNCECLGCVGEGKAQWEFGKSFECIGKPVHINLYVAGETTHANDLSHCVWTVRGWNRYWVNNEDLVQCIELFIVAALKAETNRNHIKRLIQRGFDLIVDNSNEASSPEISEGFEFEVTPSNGTLIRKATISRLKDDVSQWPPSIEDETRILKEAGFDIDKPVKLIMLHDHEIRFYKQEV